MLLRIKDAVVHYNKVAALKGVSFGVEEGTAVAVIGANGAGKTTSLRAISGLVGLSSGEIWFEGRRVDGLPAEKVVGLGIAHVPEGRRVFPELSVYENLMTGAYLRKDQRAIARDLEQVYGYFPRLEERQSQWAKTLSGGEQQMLAIGRALMAAPKLLLLDEPSMGLSPLLVQEIGRIVQRIIEDGVPVVLVEQNAEVALGLADYAYVLETGNMSLEGDADRLKEDGHVREAYLGM